MLARWLERIGNHNQGWHNFFRYLMFIPFAAAVLARNLCFDPDVFELLPT